MYAYMYIYIYMCVDMYVHIIFIYMHKLYMCVYNFVKYSLIFILRDPSTDFEPLAYQKMCEPYRSQTSSSN